MKPKIFIPLLLVFSFIFYFLISFPYFSGDVKNHIVWGRSILNDGAPGFYGRYFKDYSFPNYPPISMGFFALSVLVFDNLKNTTNSLNDSLSIFPSNLVHLFEWENTEITFLKLPAIIPAVLTLIFIYLLVGVLEPKLPQDKKYLITILYVLNPAVVYLVAIWGQNDLLQNFFMLGAYYFLLRKKLWISFIFAGLAILSKQTVLMLWGVYFITVFKLYGVNKSILGFMTSVVLVWLLYLPFNESSLIWPFTFYKETLKTTGYLVSDNAINFWGAIFNFQPVDAAENRYLIAWEYWGFVLFILAFLPLVYKFLKEKFTNIRLMLLLFLTSGIYFFILTRMHERYLIPTLLFSVLLLSYGKKFIFNYTFITVLLFLNLYRGLYQPMIPLFDVLVKDILFLNLLVLFYFGLLVYNYYLYMFKLEKLDNEQ